MLCESVVYVDGKPELDSGWIEFRNKLDDVEYTSFRGDGLAGAEESLIPALDEDLLGLCFGDGQAKLTAGVCGAPLLRFDAKFLQVTSGMGTIHSEAL